MLDHQLAMIRKISQVQGTTPWVLMDFRSTTRNIPKLQDGYNRKGLFSEKMEKKLGAATVQKTYTEHNAVQAK